MMGKQFREEEKEEIRRMAIMPFCGSIPNQIARQLQKWNAKMASRHLLKMGQYLGSVKESLELNVPGIYQIASPCVAGYIGQMGINVMVR